jgi:hypothetical protein
MTPDQFKRTNLRTQLRQLGYSEHQIMGAVDAAMAHARVTDISKLLGIARRHAGNPIGRHQPFSLTPAQPSPARWFDSSTDTGYSPTTLAWALDPLWRKCQRLALSNTDELYQWLFALTPANLDFLSRLLPFADNEPQGRPIWQAAVIARPLIAQALANRVAQP